LPEGQILNVLVVSLAGREYVQITQEGSGGRSRRKEAFALAHLAEFVDDPNATAYSSSSGSGNKR